MPAYSVVRIKVSELRGHCPFYKQGDTFLIKQQCLDPSQATPDQFCFHSLKDLYDAYMEVRRGPIGGMRTIGCMDHAKARFQLERMADEEGPGWN
ncbi:MAG: hypothetical protein HY321_12470 [Armatimonadetes bacterium]|nr:hypothetical protein [Armatimonadota bacterium]